jgi:transposase
MPSKFTSQRRATVLQVLRAGGSIREASRVVGLSHSTVVKWIQRGERAAKVAPHSMYARFAQAVREAEAGGPELLALKNRWGRSGHRLVDEVDRARASSYPKS